jgi:ATP-dependent protease ClpP protease subunit
MTEYTCNTNGNNVYYSGEISQEGVLQLASTLHNLDSEKRSTLYLSSNGGEVYAGLFMYDLITAQDPDLFSIKVCGYAGSAATLCLFAIPNVYMTKHSSLFFHQMQSTLHRSRHLETKAYTEHLDTLNAMLLNIFRKKMNVDCEFLNKDKYYTSQEALEAGIIKDIVF